MIDDVPGVLTKSVGAGFARSTETLSLHAVVFGVGITLGAGSMLVPVASGLAIGGWMVPGGRLGGMSGVETGRAAALVSVMPGAEVHELAGVELPSAGAGATVPVELPVTDPTIVTGAAVGKVGKRLVVAAGMIVPGIVVVVPVALMVAVGLIDEVAFVEVTLATDGESSTSVGAQLTLVPGNVGSSANGVEARVVAGAPGTVEAEKRLENGLGPVSGDDTIAPGVVGTPIALVPMVETCAGQMPPLSKSTAIALRTVRIQIPSIRLTGG